MRVLPPMPEQPAPKPRRRWGKRRRQLDETGARLNEKAIQLQQLELALMEKRTSLQKWELELQNREFTVQELTHTKPRKGRAKYLPLDGDTGDMADGYCAQCGYMHTLISFRVFQSDTRRKRRTYMCSQECALEYDQIQRDLIEGEEYVRRSLGVAQ